MSFPCYSSYKDSGVEWLGEIPSHWGCEPLKYSTEIYTGNSLNDTEKQQYESIDENDIPYVSSKDLDLQTRTINYENGLRVPVESNKLKVAPKNSFLLCIEGGSAGKKIALLKQDVCFVNKLCCFKDKNDARFKYFLAQSKNFKDKFDLSMTGLIGGVSTSALKNFSTPVPSDEERDSIVNFLEYETTKIDALVDEQYKLISLLKEKHQALISIAVTKGLDPKAKMKDSGVQWLGEIPAHWETISLKRLCSLLKDGTHLPPARVDEGVPLLSVRNLQNSKFGLLDDDSFISEENYADLSRSFIPKENDVLLAIVGGTIGKTALVPKNIGLFHIQRSLAIFRTNANLLPNWLWRLFQSSGFQALLWEYVGYSAQPGIYLGTLSEFKVSVPPTQEQHNILKEIEPELNKIDILIEKSAEAVSLLHERRSALISAAVTGQIDVRNYLSKEVS